MSDNLFDGISPVNKQSWLTQVNKDLKGAEFNEQLTSEVDGQKIRPLYSQEDLPEIIPDNDEDFEDAIDEEIKEILQENGTQVITWNICEEFTLQENEYLNDIVIKKIKRGCNYIRLHTNNWEKFFDEVRKIEYAATFNLAVESDITEEDIVSTWRERIGYIGDQDRLIHAIEFDPISYWVKTGTIENENKTFNNLSDMFFRLTGHLQDCKIIKVDTSIYTNANTTEQLAYALAITSEYFKNLSARDVPLEECMYLITYRFSVSNNYFFEIAKFQAFKKLWINLIKAFLPEFDYIPNPYMHAVITNENNPDETANNNLIAYTTQAMSAILGGCEAVSILDNEKDTVNVQNILRYESYLDTYRDVAKGSFYLESITTQFAENAWKLFQEIENTGGFLENWKRGGIQ